MKRKLIILFFFTFSLLLFGQTPDWQWAIPAVGIDDDEGRAITIDENGNTYVTGYFQSTVTFGPFSLTSAGSCDIFVTKMDANGNWLWVTQAGGVTGSEMGLSIALDDNGNIYLSGYFQYTVTFGPFTLTSNGLADMFIAKMDANGNWLWVTQAGGGSIVDGRAIALDDNNNIYVAGTLQGWATFGPYFHQSTGWSDIFIAKLDANGNWQWVIQAGGSDIDHCYAIAIDDNGNSYVTGSFESTATFGPFSLTSAGSGDIFVAKIDANGNWQWVTQAGGSGNARGHAIAIDDFENSILTGFFFWYCNLWKQFNNQQWLL